MRTIACCLVVRLGSGFWLDLVSDWSRICTTCRCHCHAAHFSRPTRTKTETFCKTKTTLFGGRRCEMSSRCRIRRRRSSFWWPSAWGCHDSGQKEFFCLAIWQRRPPIKVARVRFIAKPCTDRRHAASVWCKKMSLLLWPAASVGEKISRGNSQSFISFAFWNKTVKRNKTSMYSRFWRRPSMRTRVQRTTSSCFAALRQLRQIRRLTCFASASVAA